MFKFHRRIKYLFPEAKELYVVFRPRINFGNKLQGPLRHISKMEISKKKVPVTKLPLEKGTTMKGLVSSSQIFVQN